MLRYYILIISFLLLIPLANARETQSNKPLVREIFQYRADSVIRYQYYYDEFMNKVMEVKHIVRGNMSEPRIQTEWIYDQRRCVMQRTRTMINGQWVTLASIETNFEGDLKTREIFREFTEQSESIVKVVTYQYDNQRLSAMLTYPGNPEFVMPVKELNIQYNKSDSTALQHFKFLQDSVVVQYINRFTYNEDGRIDSIISTQFNDSSYVSSHLSLHYYNDKGQLTMQIQKYMNKATLRWINAARLEYAYNEQGKLIEEVYSSYTGMFWKPNTRYTYSYDNAGLLAGKTMFQPVYQEWRRFFTVEYGENLNSRPSLMESKYNFWGGNTGDYVETYIPFYFNDEIVQLRADKIKLSYLIDPTNVDQLADNTVLRVYPNPSDGIFYISTQSQEIQSWEVFNMSGALLKKAVNRFHTGVVDITNLVPGAYLLRVHTTNQQIFNQKIFIKR